MTARFEIRLHQAEGAVLRTLGLIQRRGFTIREIRLEPGPGHQRLRLALADSTRDPAVLRRQIERLHDVISVRPQARRAARRVRLGRLQALMQALVPKPRVAARRVGA